jgi:hypothetical protein
VSFLIDESQAMLRNCSALNLPALDRVFTIRTNEGFIVEFGGTLLRRLTGAAPQAGLRFAVKAEKDARALREAHNSIKFDQHLYGSYVARTLPAGGFPVPTRPVPMTPPPFTRAPLMERPR